MLPPPAPPRSSKNNPYNHPSSSSFLPPHPSNNHPPKKPGESNKQRPRTSNSSSRSNSNNVEYEEKKVQDMIRQMLDPISGNNNQMPALLSAIVTPSITEHEGNNNRSVPRYLPTPGLLPPPIGKISPLHGTSKSNLSEESDSDKEEMDPPAKTSVKISSPIKIINNSDSNSTAESSSDDSSESEDEEEGGGVGKVMAQEDSNEDEEEFSLATLAKKANLSKFSPSSNPATVHKENSPIKKLHNLEQSVPPAHNEKSPPDVDIDFISGLLTTSTPDINLDFAGTSIDRPISPMKQSPEHEDIGEDISPPTPPPPPPPPKIKEPLSSGSSRSSSRRRSSANTNNLTPVMVDSSDEECISVTKRTPRPKKSRTKKEEPQSKKAKSQRRRSSSSKRKLSSEDEDEDDEKDSKMFMSSDSSERHHIPLEGIVEKLQSEDTSPVAASNKKKNMALGNIFGVKTSSSKGGGKGKAGIKVEVIERQSNENPSNISSTTTVPSPVIMETHQAVTKDKLKPEIAIVQPRPRLLCRIPLRLLNHPLPHLNRRHHNHPRTTNTLENLDSRRNLFDDDEEECKGKIMTDVVKMQTAIDSNNTSVKRRNKASVSADPLSASSKRLKLDPEEDAAASNKMSEYLVEQNNKCMMPPPSKRSSYLDTKDEEDDNEEEQNFCMSEAKRLKDEADKERDREQQAMKYIQAVLYFILCGNITERNGDKYLALGMYNQTLSFIRDVCRPFKNSEFGNFDNKLAALSLRCQSLLYLKMYKLTQNEYRECQKIIGEHIMKASQQNSPNSNTPSPAGSDGSRSSGYTSSGEINNGGGGSSSRYTGIATPPTASLTGTSSHNLPPQCLTVPQNVMKKHFQYGTYLTQCHYLWEQADMYLHRGHCEEFIKRLDRMCGPLTLHSSLKDLVKYIRTGLNFWSKEREEALAASSGVSGSTSS
uniref:AF4/FMR2 family member lilli n=1 Tax=Lepeophtheirus salmonis TaxID=72036 RepID=A0A0K2TGK9_LEPSM